VTDELFASTVITAALMLPAVRQFKPPALVTFPVPDDAVVTAEADVPEAAAEDM
jgi:hypothetical protein